MVACIDDVEMEDGNVVLKVGGGSVGIGGKQNCNCSQESDWCSYGEKCRNADCQTKPGCGFLWMHQCDGRCNDTAANG
jgi:hypothetical protein